MNAIVQIHAGITMSSLELVQFINNQREAGAAELAHSDFLKKVPQVLGEGVGNFSDTYKHPQNGQTYPCYKFPKREACLMAMSYSYDLQAKVFDRMTELESKVDQPNPMAILESPAGLRSVLLGYVEKVIALEERVVKQDAISAQQVAVIAEQAPKVEALNRIAISDGSFNLREAAKVLQMKERDFLQYLHNRSWVYRNQIGNRWMAHATTLRQGYMEHKTTTGTKDDGSEWTSSQAKITPKGIARLATMLGVDISADPGDQLLFG